MTDEKIRKKRKEERKEKMRTFDRVKRIKNEEMKIFNFWFQAVASTNHKSDNPLIFRENLD